MPKFHTDMTSTETTLTTEQLGHLFEEIARFALLIDEEIQTQCENREDWPTSEVESLLNITQERTQRIGWLADYGSKVALGRSIRENEWLLPIIARRIPVKVLPPG